MTQQRALSRAACIDYGIAAKPMAGEAFSGDACFVRTIDDDVLLAVIDGIGHGRQAADVANTAIAVLESHFDQPLLQLVEGCHRALVQKRGVVMTLVSIQSDANLLSWLGIGNIRGGVLVGGAQCGPHWTGMPSLSGIIGHRLPRLWSSKMAIAPGDWVVLATDGVRSDFYGEIAMNGAPQEVATGILSRFGVGNDDALVLVARYRGKGL